MQWKPIRRGNADVVVVDFHIDDIRPHARRRRESRKIVAVVCRPMRPVVGMETDDHP